ncbi:MAG: hypothetical protein HY051_01110 [Candidatus Aenigmarchaeota archaeon]|nr:hypothetical protein [Candidatus Aenigmarchaeota archaeon]
MTESIQRIYTRVSLITNPIDLSEAATRIFKPLRQLTNSISLTGISTRISPAVIIDRISTLAISLAENAQKIFASISTRSVTDSITINHITGRVVSFPRQITQAVDITQMISGSSILNRITSLQLIIKAIISPNFNTVSAMFTISTPVVAQNEFVEFDMNVQNTGTATLNVSAGTEVYNSSGILVRTVNSTNVTIAKGESKTIVTFLNTINLNVGNYRAEGRVLFDNRATINITKSFNITSVANVQIGNYTNTSINITENVRTLIVANTSTNTIINIEISLNSTQEGALATAEFSSVENQTISGQAKLGKFISITASPNITNNLKWYLLNISYTDGEVSAAGVTESGLRIWFYNTTTAAWQQESGNVDTTNNYVYANVSHFSLFGIYSQESAQPSPAAPTGGGGGGGTTTKPVIRLPSVEIEFIGWSVLREVVPGQSLVESIKVRNKGDGNLTDLQIKVSGVPADWVYVNPGSIDLLPKESKVFNLVITAPKDAVSGDYRLLFTLKNEKVEDSNFMIVRVKNYPATYDKPIITRIIQLNYEINRTKVVLDINNPIKHYLLIQLQEDMPKELAQSSDEVEFNPYPDRILRSDPLVEWDVKDLKVKDNRKLIYATKGILDEFTPYIYLPLKELKITETMIPTGLKIVDIGVQPLFAGKSSIGRVTVENTGQAAKRFEFSMQLPSGWGAEPQKIEVTLQPRERKEFKFSVIVPANASPGDYIGTAIIYWGEDTHIKELVLRVESTETITLSIFIYGLLVLMIAVIAYMIYQRHKKKRQLSYKLRVLAENIRG